MPLTGAGTSRRKQLLMVYMRGGAPLEYAMPRIAARADVHMLTLQPLAPDLEAVCRRYSASVIDGRAACHSQDAVTGRVIAEAQRLSAHGLLTLSEVCVTPVAQAAGYLGLPGAGRHAVRARDKRLMRESWDMAGVPSPRFLAVRSATELGAAFRELTPPMLLKAAWGTGSVGQLVLRSEGDVTDSWEAATAAVATAHQTGVIGLLPPGAAGEFLVEEVIPGSIRGWWPEDSGYGDYLSVEGIVAGGTYHPLCITSRLPTIPPFTEVSNLAPCVLAEPLQRKIEAVATAAVDVLGLENCGTHTELKLKDDGELAVLEVAGRFGGVMVVPEIERVYGYDALGALVDVLVGEPADFPSRMFTHADAKGAAGSLSLIATNAEGLPWRRRMIWDSTVVEWEQLLSAGSTIEIVHGLSIPDGTAMPAYDRAAGIGTYGGIFFVQASDAPTLVRDCYAVLNGLEEALSRGWAGAAQGGQGATR